jgi:hypothetical protein
MKQQRGQALSRILANRNKNKTLKKLKLLHHYIIVFHHYIGDKNELK